MTNEWNPGRPDSVSPPMAQGPPARRPLHPAERRQRNLIIGLSVGAVLVLLAGMITFVATQENRGSATPAASTSSLPEQVVPATSAPAPSTAETTTTVPSTTTVILANADAGEDLAVDQSVEFVLVANDLAEGTPNEAVRWTQTAGPDVTAGVGALSGPEVAAIAPSVVSTLVFTLEVAGTDGTSSDDVIVRVFEDVNATVFVDGELGNDAAAGSMSDPFQSLSVASQVAEGRDIYVRSAGVYDTSDATLDLTDGVSLYGGFDENWMLDTNRRTVISGAPIAVRAAGSASRSISAVEVTAADADSGNDSAGVLVQGAGALRLLDSRVVGGAGGDGLDGGPGGQSSGVVLVGVAEARIERSTVNASAGGRGADGIAAGLPAPSTERAENGSDGNEREGGSGGGSGALSGGSGGRGGNTSSGADAPGGAAGGTSGAPDGEPGLAGSGGNGGRGGNGGVGVVTADDGSTVPTGHAGAPGEAASDGAGGNGGGGGHGPVFVDGGGGAGGGAGGAASAGAAPGGGGGGSIGLWTVGVARLVVVESLIAGGRAGNGGSGAEASPGQIGGQGGNGAGGVNGLLADGGSGGGGGGGGGGGAGGSGGGGAGGASFGMLTTNVSSVEISATTVRGGGGGDGADGGIGGAPGVGGSDGNGREGGAGGISAADLAAEAGVGASGGDSYGWFDDHNADQRFDAVELVEGAAGVSGNGSGSGINGVEGAANVSFDG